MLLSSHDEASATVVGSARALALDVSSAPRSHRQSRPRKILCAIIFWQILNAVSERGASVVQVHARNLNDGQQQQQQLAQLTRVHALLWCPITRRAEITFMALLKLSHFPTQHQRLLDRASHFNTLASGDPSLSPALHAPPPCNCCAGLSPQPSQPLNACLKAGSEGLDRSVELQQALIVPPHQVWDCIGHHRKMRRVLLVTARRRVGSSSPSAFT